MRYFILDVFTDQLFKGNQLAVVLDADGLPDSTMEAIAAEFNFSETTFVLRPSTERASIRVRIFTPAVELPLAGHPVIGTWYLLAAQKLIPAKEGWTTFYQELQAGILPVDVLMAEGRVQQVRMTQAKPEYFEIVSDDRLLQALGLSFADIDNTLPAQFVSTGVKQLMLPLQSRAALQRIQPSAADLSRLLADRDSYLVYAFAEEAGAIYARGFFAAGAAMFEDAATGSAAGALGAYLWKHRNVATPFLIRQGIEMGRSAKIDVDVSDDGRTVRVGGTAVIVASGELFL
jgi:trans-2,3-dihydro-3-hydroxyanthranilate isomerase